GATTVSLARNKDSLISQYADINIEVVTGPEVLTGSTRMKAATAHKLVLNMITTTTTSNAGTEYENLMIDLKVSNQKLKERAKNIVSTITGVTYEQSEKVLEVTNYEVKPAIVMVRTGCNFEKALASLEQTDGYVRKAIEMINHGE